MKSKAEDNEFGELRRQAEQKIRSTTRKLHNAVPQDLQTLIHELEIHQVELEIQNEELRRARQDLEESQRQYADLYDFAPTGYFLLDGDGIIRSCNSMGARMLGRDKHDLLNLPFVSLVVREDWDTFSAHLRETFARQVRQTQELRLRTAQQTTLDVQLQSVVALEREPQPLFCRTAVIDITERKRMEQTLRELSATLESRVAQRTAELKHRARQLQKLTLELARAEDRERRRVAMTLHEDLQQQLAVVKFHLSRLASRVKKDASLYPMVLELDRLLANAIAKSRRLSYDLNPAALHLNDLDETLHSLAKQTQTKYGLTVHVDIRGGVTLPSETLAMFLFRAAQEMLLNVARHAGVHDAVIRVRRVGSFVYLSVSDRGCGFEPQTLQETPGFGLLSIRERVELLGGRMKIRSRPGQGSIILVAIPTNGLLDAAPPA